MKFVFVLEDDEKFQKEIVEAINSIDPKLQIRLFSQLAEFVSWIKIMLATGPAAISQGGASPSWLPADAVANEEHQLVAVVSKIEYLGVRQIPLLKKTRDQFIKKKICTPEDPTAFVLTTFEEPQFKVMDLRDRILNNVIFKPFDRLILIQDLTYAIDGRHPPSKYTVANLKTTALVEMLKDVKMVAFNEVGFITHSDRKLETQVHVAKYYSKIFAGLNKISVMAGMLRCQVDVNNPQDHICSFSFFGLSLAQIAQMRRKVRASTADYNYNWEDDRKEIHRSNRILSIVLVEENETIAKELIDSLQRKFKSLQVSYFKNLIDFLTELDPQMAGIKIEPLQAVPSDQDVLFTFDPTGLKIIQIEHKSKDPLNLFAAAEADLKAPDFWTAAIGNREFVKWKERLELKNNEPLLVTVQGQKFFVKIKLVTKDEKNQFNVIFENLSAAEQAEYQSKNSRIPLLTDAIFVSGLFIEPTEIEKWQKIKDLLKERAKGKINNLQPDIFILASREYIDNDLRAFGMFVTDIFYRPVDRAYLNLKLKFFFPELSPSDDPILFPTLKNADMFHTATPVQVSEISEAGLVMQYHRAMSLGSFREFVLWQPYEVDAPKLVGNCNFTEESGTKGVTNHHFVFFGMTDLFLKSIRIWIRDHYILSKEH